MLNPKLIRADLAKILNKKTGAISCLCFGEAKISGYLNLKTEIILNDGAVGFLPCFICADDRASALKAGQRVLIDDKSFTIKSVLIGANGAIFRVFLKDDSEFIIKDEPKDEFNPQDFIQ